MADFYICVKRFEALHKALYKCAFIINNNSMFTWFNFHCITTGFLIGIPLDFFWITMYHWVSIDLFAISRCASAQALTVE